MKKFLILLILVAGAWCVSQAQPGTFNRYLQRVRYISIMPDSLQGLPSDTFFVQPVFRSLHWITAKGDSIYKWSPSLQRWVLYNSGGGGGSITGTGIANRIAYWNGTTNLTSSANLTYDGFDFSLGAGKFTVNANGQISRFESITPGPGNLMIGNGSIGAFKMGALTSSNGSITINYSSPNIDITATPSDDTTRITAFAPLYAPCDTCIAIPIASLEDTGAATPGLVDSVYSAIRSTKVYNDGFGDDSIYAFNGYGDSSLVYVNRVAITDGWIDVPAVAYSGIPNYWNIGFGRFRLNGHTYDVAPTQLLVDTANATQFRNSKFVSDTSGQSTYLPGTLAVDEASAVAVSPTIDPGFQIEITDLLIRSIPEGGVHMGDTDFIYKNNAEWTVSQTGTTVDPDNTTPGSVWEGTKSLSITNWNGGDIIMFTQGGSVDVSQFQSVNGFIKLKQAMPAAASIRARWYLNSSGFGSFVTIPLDKNNTTTYQAFSLPIASFGLTTNIATAFSMQYAGTSTNNAGAYIDYLHLQNGISQTPTATQYVAGTDIIISGQTISADTTNGATKLATQGDITRAISASIPNLQAVNNAGNLTTTNMISSNLAGDSTIIKNGSIEVYNAFGGASAVQPGYVVAQNAFGHRWIAGNEVGMNNAGSGFNTSLQSIDPTAGNTLYLRETNTTSHTDTIANLADVRAGAGAGGTVTSFSKTDGFGISSSVANSTTTPNHTIAIDSASAALKTYIAQYSAQSFPDGTISSPGISFSSDATDGFSHTNSFGGEVLLSIGGVQALRLTHAPTPGGSNIAGEGGTYIGYNTGVNNNNGSTSAGVNNTFVGATSGQSNTDGSDLAFFGSRSGPNNTTGVNNTFLGQGSGFSNVSGSSNIYIGRHAGLNFLASDNIVIGVGSEGAASATANANTFVGNLSGQAVTSASKNAGFGRQSLQAMTSASDVTALGYNAGFSLTTGSENTLVGMQAGFTATSGNALTTGSQNVFIGKNSGFASSTQRTNSVAIGYAALVDANNTMALGNSSMSVTIGATTATARLHLPAGTATASTAPLKFTAGTNLGTTEAGAIEYDGTHLYFTASNAGTRFQLDQQSAAGIVIGSTAITSGTNGRVLYDNSGVVGEMTTSGSGTQLALANSPTLTTPVISSITNTGTLTLPTVTGTVMAYSEANISSNATWSPQGDARENYYDITGQTSAATTISNPSGTPANHNVLYMRVKDNGTARALTWSGSQWRASTDLPLPTTTVASKTMYLKFMYNSADTKWDFQGYINNFGLAEIFLLSIVFGGLATYTEKKVVKMTDRRRRAA